MSLWKGKKVVITGGNGFLGKQLVALLEREGADVFVPRSKNYDLTNLDAAKKLMKDADPDIVFHSAAYYGGLGINQTEPGTIFYINLVMGASVMEAARMQNVEKFITIGTACSYPGYLEGNLKEIDLWAGPVHDSVAHYGVTKKTMQIQGIAYKKQYNFSSIHVILTNLYGPGDSYNPKRSHVVAALIRKFVEAKIGKNDTVEVWGTGKPIREFMHVKAAAEAIIHAAKNYNSLDALNIGTGTGTTIKELVESIQEITEFKGNINWNTEKPDGQYRKILDVTKLQKDLSWTNTIPLKTGLKDTIEWYEEHKNEADQKW